VGRLLDRIGTRQGLSISVLFYSAAAMLTSLATGLRSFCTFRFLLGLGEAGNWPGAAKVVAEWFPASERGWAVALYDSGSAAGAAIAPALVFWAYHSFGSWRPVFLVTGSLGLLWLILFRLTYRAGPLAGNPQADALRAMPWRTLLRMPKTWGIIIGKTLTDPVWFFITDWFAIFLLSRGFRIEESLMAFWLPFLAADAGNFLGGGVSSYLITRGWNVVRARKAVVVVSGVGMAVLGAAAVTQSLGALILLFAISTLSYAALSTMLLNLPADVYPPHSVATVSGLSGTGAGLGTIVATYFIGKVADASSFAPVLMTASVVPLIAAAVVVALIPNEPDSVIVPGQR
jgi:ACS family hexuronate transporter-like MFS transporter